MVAEGLLVAVLDDDLCMYARRQNRVNSNQLFCLLS